MRERFETPGDYEWLVPAGVTRILCRVKGAAGGACGNNPGQPGQEARHELEVTPGTTVKITVGAGGKGANGGADGADGWVELEYQPRFN